MRLTSVGGAEPAIVGVINGSVAFRRFMAKIPYIPQNLEIRLNRRILPSRYPGTTVLRERCVACGNGVRTRGGPIETSASG